MVWGLVVLCDSSLTSRSSRHFSKIHGVMAFWNSYLTSWSSRNPYQSHSYVFQWEYLFFLLFTLGFSLGFSSGRELRSSLPHELHKFAPPDVLNENSRIRAYRGEPLFSQEALSSHTKPPLRHFWSVHDCYTHTSWCEQKPTNEEVYHKCELSEIHTFFHLFLTVKNQLYG
jgi:hypothetical protein